MTKLIFLIAKLIFKGLSALFGWWAIPIMGAGIALLAYFGKSSDDDAATSESGPEDLLAAASVGSGVLAAVDDKTAEAPCPTTDTEKTAAGTEAPDGATPDPDSTDLDWIEFA